MNARSKSALLLGVTLLLGIVLGILASGTMFNRRIDDIAEMRTARGMAFLLEEVVLPENAEQRRAFREVIEQSSSEYADVFARTGAELRALNDSVLARVRPLLSSEQVQRLERHLERRREGRFSGRTRRAERGDRARRRR